MDTSNFITEKLENGEHIIPSYYNYYAKHVKKNGELLVLKNEEKNGWERLCDAMAQASNVIQKVTEICQNKVGRKTSERVSKETMCPIMEYFKDECNYKEDGYKLHFILYLGTNGEEGTSSHSFRVAADILDEIKGAYAVDTVLDNADDVYDFLICVPICVEKLKSED